MTHGIDTDFLVAVEIRDHPGHQLAVALLNRLLDGGHNLAVAPQILAEFIHVVTDAKRMPEPLSVPEAILRAEHWWHAAEVRRVFPDGQGVVDFSFPFLRLGKRSPPFKAPACSAPANSPPSKPQPSTNGPAKEPPCPTSSAA